MPGKLNICIKFINGCTTMQHSTSSEMTNRLTILLIICKKLGRCRWCDKWKVWFSVPDAYLVIYCTLSLENEFGKISKYTLIDQERTHEIDNMHTVGIDTLD